MTMVLRTWNALARSPEDADAYAEHLRTTVFPHLHTIDGHLGAYLLQRGSGATVGIQVITVWESIEAVHAFAGSDTGVAVIEPEARRLLVNVDERVTHYDIVLDSTRGIQVDDDREAAPPLP
jgi:heme-degrading monooxygenase HmoA